MKEQRAKPGAVVRIDLHDGTFTYARFLEDGNHAFYYIRKSSDPPLDEILRSSVLFIAVVDASVVRKRTWPVVYNMPLEPELKVQKSKYTRDVANHDLYFIWRGHESTPATKADCKGLEVMAVWGPEHITDRLRDHFNGKKSMWLTSIDHANN